MSIHFTAVIVRHERRVRLLFDAPLAFPGALNLALYAIGADGATAPVVTEAVAVPNTPAGVELALDRDLNDGAVYTLAAVGVPAVDTTVTAPGSTLPFVLAGDPDQTTNDEVPPVDLGALIYGTDLVWDGTDFVETDEEDLATVSGIDNFQGAEQRRLVQDYALDWASDYGARSGELVNGPSSLAGTLAGTLTRQALKDDRALSARATFAVDPLGSGTTQLAIAIVPKGAADGEPITVSVPTGG